MSHTESAWVWRLIRSDTEVCREIFAALHGSLLRYAMQFTSVEDEAYDVVQDAFVKLWSIRHTLDPELSLKAFLFKMVRNQSLNNRRKERRMADIEEVSGTLPDQEPLPDAQVETDMLGAYIHQWIGTMPPRRREAFQLSRFEHLSHEEIADVMDLTPRTVSNHIMLALVYLRDRLKQLESNPT